MATYIDIVLELYTSGTVELHPFQGLAHHIIRLSFGLLRGLNHRGFVQITAIVDIQLMECVLEGENLSLVQLRESPGNEDGCQRTNVYLPRIMGDTYFWSLRAFILKRTTWGVRADHERETQPIRRGKKDQILVTTDQLNLQEIK